MNIIVLVFCFLTIHLNWIYCVNTPIVQTKSGPVRGLTENFNGNQLNEFFGIPYAEPPIGNNRFGKPLPRKVWNTTLDANRHKNICWQTMHRNLTNQSEDCLFLNIVSHDLNDTKLRPVMFWIHGGGFHDGNGNSDVRVLASFGVVVVTVNYRVGPFGFLYGNHTSAPGNVGLYDQNLALKWVHNNIHFFGGDPTQITIFGQSAGSWSVSAHIVSPLSRNLFKRAIMESGAYYFRNYRNYNSSYHLNTAKNMSKAFGCADDSHWLDCMRKVEPQKIVDHNLISPSLIFGTEILPKTIESALEAGDYQKGIEVIAGVTESEGTTWAIAGSFGKHKLENSSVHITKNDLKTQIKSDFHRLNEAMIQSIYDYYVSKVDENNQTLMRKAYIAISTDIIIKCPTYYFTEKLSQSSFANKIRFYELTYNSVDSSCRKQEWYGICHSDDGPFVFGYPIKNKSKYPQIEYDFSVMVNKIWTNFAKTGNPLSVAVVNTQGVNITDWPTFKASESSAVITRVMELHPKNFGHIWNNPYYNNCDIVWKKYFETDYN